MVVFALVSGGLARLAAEIIRFFFPRARPFSAEAVLETADCQINLLINYPDVPGFPSGHAAFYFGIAGAVLIFLFKIKRPPKLWRLIALSFFLVALLVVVGRVFSGIHWPSDILIGMVIGILSAFLIGSNKIFD